MQLTKNFKLSEFIDSRFYKSHQHEVWKSFEENRDILLPNIKLLANQLQILRDYTDEPITINIAYRPLFWELKQGRSGKSQHCKGKAADIVINNYTPLEIYNLIEDLNGYGVMKIGGLGKYNSFTHLDVRQKRARW